jgi:hypothetical protein
LTKPMKFWRSLSYRVATRLNCLSLLSDPLRRRVSCDVDPDEISAINPYNNQAVQQFEANGRDHEQIHGGNVRSVVSQEGLPPLKSFHHILGHG